MLGSQMVPQAARVLIVLPAIHARDRLAKVRALDMTARVTAVTELAVTHRALELAELIRRGDDNELANGHS